MDTEQVLRIFVYDIRLYCFFGLQLGPTKFKMTGF